MLSFNKEVTRTGNFWNEENNNFWNWETDNLINSVVEPDFLAGAGAGEKAPAPGCCCLA